MSNVSLYNVFIFNFIKNNQKDIELLEKTFVDLECIVKLIDQPTMRRFYEEVDYIANKIFTIYRYVVVIVLANRNPGDDILSTADNEEVFLNRDLVNKIHFNDTLRLNGIKLLIVEQINKNILEDQYVEDLEKRNPPQLSGVPGKWRSNASRQYTQTQLEGITIRLSAKHNYRELNDYWQTETPPVSPFIQGFCDSFREYSMTEGIDKIYREIYYHMEKHCTETPSLEKLCNMGPGVFGSPFHNLEQKQNYVLPQLRRLKRLIQ